MTGEFDLYRARINRGMSTNDVAEAAAVSVYAVRRLERGERTRPRVAKAVADLFGVDVEDFPQFAAAESPATTT